MNPKKTKKSYNSEHYKRVKQAAAELDSRIQDTSTFSHEAHHNDHFTVLGWLIALFLLGVALWSGVPIHLVLLMLVLLVLPSLCKVYGVLVAGYTIFSGIKLFFSGQYFSVVPVLPFTIINPSLSYFCLGWGLFVAGRHSRSNLGILLGTANLLGSGLGLFRFTQSNAIIAPGYWGSAISGLLTIGLGCSMLKVISESWSRSKTG